MRRFELVEGSSSKFWEIDASGETLTVRFGRLGTNGQTQTKALGSPRAAMVEHDKLVREKVRKGYAEVGATPAPPPASPAARMVPRAAGPQPAVGAPGAAAGASGAIIGVPPSSDRVTPSPFDPRGDLARWPPSYAARVYPTRGLRPVVPRPLPWSRVVEVARAARPTVVDDAVAALHAEVDELLARDGEPAALPAALAGVLLARVLAVGLEDPRRGAAALVDAWVRTSGPARAIECSMLGTPAGDHRQRDEGLRSFAGPSARQPGVMRPWLRIREHLSAAPADVYRSALETAERCYAGAADGGSIEALVGLAFAFPGERFAADLRDRLDAATAPRLAPALALSVRVPGDAADLLDGVPSFASALWLDGIDFEGTYLTLLAMHGEAVEPAVRGFGRRGVGRRGEEAILAVLAMSGTEASFEQVLKGAHHKPVRDVLDDAVRRAPEVTARVLARHVEGSDATARRARTLLAGLVANDASGAVRAQLTGLPAAVQMGVAVVVREDGTTVGEALPDELPEVLVAPPWLPRRRPEPPVVVGLRAPDVSEELVRHPGGSPPAWASEMPGDTEAQRLARVLHDIRVLREHQRIRDLTEDEGLAMLREAARAGKVGRGWIGVGLSRSARNAVLREMPPSTFTPTPRVLQQIVADEGVDAIGILLHLARAHLPLVLAAMHRLRSARLAPLAAAGLAVKTEATREAATRWLTAHPEAATAGLLAAALGRIGAPRTGAETALRRLDAAGHGAVVRDVARRAGVGPAIEALLAADPRDERTAPCPSLPPFVQPAALPPLVTRSGRTLSAAHTETFARLLALSTLERAEPGVAQVREALTGDSLEAFSWALFQAWLDHGGSTREVWAFTQLALIGGDRAARELTPMVRRWPGESAHARAVRGLEILAAIGSDVALMNLYGLSQKGKFKALLDRARVLVREVAARRGLTPSQLGDRLIPHLGLDADGTLALDLGARTFQVGFDEQLRPFVRGADGKRLADLPKPRADDDPERAAEAHTTWKALKKDVRAIATQQIARLETAMVGRRRWPVEELRSFVVDHPLLVHLARRVVWGSYSEHGELLTVLRVTEDRSFADENDEAVEVPAQASIGVVHPVELTAEQLRTLSSLFADYEILQPFDQLSRVVHVVPPGEEHRAVEGWVGRKVPSVRVVALEHRGWRRGEVWDAGIVHTYERAAGDGIGATIGLEPGIPLGSPSMVPEQTLLHVSFGGAARGGLRIATSEILRDLALLEG